MLRSLKLQMKTNIPSFIKSSGGFQFKTYSIKFLVFSKGINYRNTHDENGNRIIFRNASPVVGSNRTIFAAP